MWFSNSKAWAILYNTEKVLTSVVRKHAHAGTLINERLIERITTLRGIGLLTVETFLMQTLQQPDILPVDDFGVQEGW